MTPNKSASPAQISDEPNPLLIVCEFCHSKPYYACINTSTQRPMPFYHMARIRDARSRLEPVEAPEKEEVCANTAEKSGTCAPHAKDAQTAETVSATSTTETIPAKMNTTESREPVEAVSTTPNYENMGECPVCAAHAGTPCLPFSRNPAPPPMKGFHKGRKVSTPLPQPLTWEAMAGSIIDTVHMTGEDYVNEKLVEQLKRYFGGKL